MFSLANVLNVRLNLTVQQHITLFHESMTDQVTLYKLKIQKGSLFCSSLKRKKETGYLLQFIFVERFYRLWPPRFEARNPPAGLKCCQKARLLPSIVQSWRYSCFPWCSLKATLLNVGILYCIIVTIFKKKKKKWNAVKNKFKLVNQTCGFTLLSHGDKTRERVCGLSISHLYFCILFKQRGTQIYSLKGKEINVHKSFSFPANKK